MGSTKGTSENGPPPSIAYLGSGPRSKSFRLWYGWVLLSTGNPRCPIPKLWPVPTIPTQSKGRRDAPSELASGAPSEEPFVTSVRPVDASSGPASSPRPASWGGLASADASNEPTLTSG